MAELALQVVTTLAAVAYVAMALTGAGGPAAVVLGGGLALSSTAVAMQVLQDRNETGSRHGRAAFAVLLLQVRSHAITSPARRLSVTRSESRHSEGKVVDVKRSSLETCLQRVAHDNRKAS